MTYLTLGQFNIPVVWLAFFIALIFSDFRSKHTDALTNKTIEKLMYTYIAVWKLSYIAFSWADFVKAPLSLVYFDGGIKGHLLALLTISIVLYRKRQVLVWPEVWLYWSRLISMYSVIYALFQQQWIVALIWVILVVLIEIKYRHWLLLVQFLLLAILYGFTSSLTLLHLLVLLTLAVHTKQVQYIAVAGLMSLVAMTIGDIEQASNIATARGAIDLPTTTGEQYRLQEQPQQLTVVNFFATWCPPCKAEMPHLQSFAKELPLGVEIIGINLTDRDEGLDALNNFMDTYDVTYPIL
ncbi:MAG: TlpA disulfide reductase family protein, partial [Lysinibacillus sp.]